MHFDALIMNWTVAIVLCCFGVVHVLGQSPVGTAKDGTVEEKAAKFMKEAEDELLQMAQKAVLVEWNFASNITDETEKKALEFKVVELH